MIPSARNAVFLLAVTFLLGLGAGITGAHWWEHRLGGPGWSFGRGSDGYQRMLERELDLKPTQRDSVHAILTRHSAAVDSLWADVGPRLDTLRTRIRSEIREQLTPAQQSTYSAICNRIDAGWRRMKESRDSQ